MADLVIKNGRVVTPAGVMYGGVAVQGEIITHVESDSNLPRGKRTINAEGCFVIPGLIDPHVHMGSEEDDSLDAGFRANLPPETDGALHGGVTTFGHFVGVKDEPLSPRVDTTIKLAEQLSYVDFFLHAFVTDRGHLAELPKVYQKGITSFKLLFNAYKPREGAETLNWMGPADEGMLFQTLEFTLEQGYPGLTMVHCEEADIYNLLEERLQKAGRNDLAAWTESHPNFVESIRIIHAFEIAKAVGAPLYVAHISTAEGVDIVSLARRQGYPIWGETCPHYLTHTGEMEGEIGGWGKVNPALKYPRDRDRLWRGILDGGITNLGNDHGTGGRVPATRTKGGTKHNNIWNSRPGIRGGLEHLLPVMMTYGVHTGRITIEDMVNVCSTNSAKAFGLYPRKGVILPGSHADLVIVDPDKEAVIDKNYYHCLCEVSIYEGWRVRGMAKTVLVRGKVMMKNFQTIGQRGQGRYIPCQAY
jgi:dihydropyrimidinase/dihydroorotase